MSHHPLSPSSAHRWMHCAASARVEAEYQETTSACADEGTRAHAEASAAIANACRPNDDALGTYYDEVMRRSTRATRSLEEKLSIACVYDGAGMDGAFGDALSGTADCVVREPFGRLTVIDYKHGVGTPVHAEGNPQLAAYLVAAWEDGDYSEACGVIVQPRCPDVPPVQEVVYTPEDMKKWREVLRTAAMVASRPLAANARTPGDWCKFCRAAGDCQALHDRNLALATADFRPACRAMPPDPDKLSAEQAARVLENAELLRGWLVAVEQWWTTKAIQGEVVPRHKLVQGRGGNRKWTDEAQVAEIIRQQGKDPMRHEVVSPAQAEKVLGRASYKALDLDALTVQSEGRLILVGSSDRRPEVACGALGSDMFEQPAKEIPCQSPEL
jgi:hypothetical protein